MPHTRIRRAGDALLLAAAIATGPLSRRSVRATAEEARDALPGDRARSRWTNAITIHARPREIWPWLVQMGSGRAGWYSYDGLDNDGQGSADTIIPELQHIELHDLLPWTSSGGEGFSIAELDPERALVLTPPADDRFRAAWAFVLEPIDSPATRLIVRVSGDYDRKPVALAVALIAHPIHFAMQRKQLLNLKQRVERDRAVRNAVPISDGEAATLRRQTSASGSGLLR